MSLNNTEGGVQSETAAGSHVFRREERLEHAILYLGRDSSSAVANFDQRHAGREETIGAGSNRDVTIALPEQPGREIDQVIAPTPVAASWKL